MNMNIKSANYHFRSAEVTEYAGFNLRLIALPVPYACNNPKLN